VTYAHPAVSPITRAVKVRRRVQEKDTGKRFARMKTRMAYGPGLVFHRIRKTVATQFEDAQVPEGVTADILGHAKNTITHGLYSGGASMRTKREALEKTVQCEAKHR
jgi:integrase